MDDHAFLEFVKTCFAQKRKTLSNNLRELIAPNELRALLKHSKLREDARAEQLTVAQFVTLYKTISLAPRAAGPDNRS